MQGSIRKTLLSLALCGRMLRGRALGKLVLRGRALGGMVAGSIVAGGIALGGIAVPLAEAHAPEHLLLDMPQAKVKALDFQAKLLDGTPIKLSDYAGQVVFLNFWATWCGPCLAELPAMNKLNRAMAGKPFVILAVNLRETGAQVARFVEEHPMSFSFVLDPLGVVARDYGVTGIPLTYVIGRDGTVMARAIGPREWASPEAVDFFTHLAAGESPSAAPDSTAPPGRTRPAGQPHQAPPEPSSSLASAGGVAK